MARQALGDGPVRGIPRVVHGPEHQHHLGAYQKGCLLGPTSDPLN